MPEKILQKYKTITETNFSHKRKKESESKFVTGKTRQNGQRKNTKKKRMDLAKNKRNISDKNRGRQRYTNRCFPFCTKVQNNNYHEKETYKNGEKKPMCTPCTFAAWKSAEQAGTYLSKARFSLAKTLQQCASQHNFFQAQNRT